MNILGLMAGDVIATVGTEIAERVMDRMMPSKAPKFLDSFRDKTYNETEKLRMEDLNLTREEEISLMEIRDYAQKKGLKSLEVEIQGRHYHLQTEDMSLVPILSSSI